MRTLIILVIVAASLTATHLDAGTKIVDYGFEDWNGHENTPGYIFRTGSYVGSPYWDYHKAQTGGFTDCQGRRAYSGNYFWRRQYYDNSSYVDPCLGRVMDGAENSHNNIGDPSLVYPIGQGDDVNFRTELTSGTAVFRVRARFFGWMGWPGMKFARFYGTGGGNLILVLRGNELVYCTGQCTDPQTVINFYDGVWHAFAMKVQILDATTLRVWTWVDDWNMQGDADLHETSLPASNFGTGFDHLALLSNFGGDSVPPAASSVELDDIEVWDGVPGGPDTQPPAPPTGLHVE